MQGKSGFGATPVPGAKEAATYIKPLYAATFPYRKKRYHGVKSKI
jgi:hypothetical protein